QPCSLRHKKHMSWIWEPSKDFIESTNVWRFLRRLGCRNREEFLRYSVDHLEEFWAEMLIETGIQWFRPYDEVLDKSRGVEWSRWFTGGKLNIVHNCLDRHVKRANPAILWEGENGGRRQISFAQLHAEVNTLAHYLSSLGLQQRDRVAMCMPMTPEVVT